MISRFEDLKVWQSARELNKQIYEITSTFPKTEQYGLTDQLRRASVSICANIAEGFGRYHSSESIQFYRTARGSLSETKSHLYLCLDLSYIKQSHLNEMIIKIDEIGKMLNSFINTTKQYRPIKKPTSEL